MIRMTTNFGTKYIQQEDKKPKHITIKAIPLVALRINNQVVVKHIKQEDPKDYIVLSSYKTRC